MEITPILPPNELPLDFDTLDCAIEGTEFSIVDDSELNFEGTTAVMELSGQGTKVKFYPHCKRPFLALYMKTIKRFVTFDVVCLDDTGEQRLISASNRNSFVTIDKYSCTIPFVAAGGWQYVLLDLEDLLANAFGVGYDRCVEISVCGSCRLSKVYFQSKKYSDIELPSFLRVVK